MAKKKRGRPRGGKSHPAVRKYWREAKRRQKRKRRKKR